MKKTNVKSKKVVEPVSKTTYRAVAKNIYHDGYSYRTRVTINGECNSMNFTSKKSAIAFRNTLKRSTR